MLVFVLVEIAKGQRYVRVEGTILIIGVKQIQFLFAKSLQAFLQIVELQTFCNVDENNARWK